jgi:acyl dehydratase
MDTPLPASEFRWEPARAAYVKLRAYRAVCGEVDDGYLPLLYPQVLGFSLQLSLMAHPDFPMPLLRVIHARNLVMQRRAIREDEGMCLSCRLGSARLVKAGCEFDVITTATIEGEAVWQGVSAYIARGNFGEASKAPAGTRLADLTDPDQESKWRVSPETGRRYAKASSDFNFVHVSSLLARLLGFKKAIAHGMWSAAACLPRLPRVGGTSVHYEAVFKGPVYLGSEVTLRAANRDNACRFDLFCGSNPRPSLCGKLRPLADTDTFV